MRYPLFSIVLSLGLLALTAVPVSAQGMGFRGWGPRLGVQSNPDQGFVGAQFNFGEFASHVRFQPNIELGFGDDHTILSTTVPAFYRFAKPASFTPYVGGGVTALLDRHDSPGKGDDTNVEVGIRVVGGRHRMAAQKWERLLSGADGRLWRYPRGAVPRRMEFLSQV
jgi:hypothetical protein